ncbi:hypothetical protein LINGRAHAP2_LOCUS11490, partial [Linum grandiflorum]
SPSQHPRLPIPVRHRRRRLQGALPQPLDALRFRTVTQGRIPPEKFIESVLALCENRYGRFWIAGL